MSADVVTILWKKIDGPGHECARLSFEGSGWQLCGASVFGFEGVACRLDYIIDINCAWLTKRAKVSGWVGNRIVGIDLEVDDGEWIMNGKRCLEVRSCKDIDLNFSPSTNLLPIRRLNLRVGENANVAAAWLRFPTMTLESLPQSYHRLDEGTYRYHTEAGFKADIKVCESGFATSYPGLWERVEAVR